MNVFQCIVGLVVTNNSIILSPQYSSSRGDKSYQFFFEDLILISWEAIVHTMICILRLHKLTVALKTQSLAKKATVYFLILFLMKNTNILWFRKNNSPFNINRKIKLLFVRLWDGQWPIINSMIWQYESHLMKEFENHVWRLYDKKYENISKLKLRREYVSMRKLKVFLEILGWPFAKILGNMSIS